MARPMPREAPVTTQVPVGDPAAAAPPFTGASNPVPAPSAVTEEADGTPAGAAEGASPESVWPWPARPLWRRGQEADAPSRSAAGTTGSLSWK